MAKKETVKKAPTEREKMMKAKAPKGIQGLVKRLISALILIPFVVLIASLGYPALSFMLLILSALMAYEWEKMTNDGKTTGMSIAVTAWLAAISMTWLSLFMLVNASPMAAMLIGQIAIASFGFLLTLPFVFFLIAHKTKYRHPRLLLFGMYYMGLPVMLMPVLTTNVLIYLLITVWLTDIGGMVVGKTLKGPKIFPKTSPGKTWAGSIGGILFAVPFGIYLSTQAGNDRSYLMMTLATVVFISVVAQAGDYLESRIKRFLSLKESGAIIPGHGGIFDRIDSLLLVIPVFTIMMVIVNMLTLPQ